MKSLCVFHSTKKNKTRLLRLKVGVSDKKKARKMVAFLVGVSSSDTSSTGTVLKPLPMMIISLSCTYKPCQLNT